jgi:hypothetical protein
MNRKVYLFALFLVGVSDFYAHMNNIYISVGGNTIVKTTNGGN